VVYLKTTDTLTRTSHFCDRFAVFVGGNFFVRGPYRGHAELNMKRISNLESFNPSEKNQIDPALKIKPKSDKTFPFFPFGETKKSEPFPFLACFIRLIIGESFSVLYKIMPSSIRTAVLIEVRLERTETNLLRFKWKVA